MRHALIILSITGLLASSGAFGAENPAPGAVAAGPISPAEFRRKLHAMLERIDKSISIVRTQITESQNAPFLADLYLQLGELLAQRANALYYIQMEKENKTSSSVSVSAGAMKFSSVIRAQKDAIQIFKLVLKDFPKFEKRPKAFHYLTVSYRSIDEIPAMIQNAAELLKEHPGSVEAMRSQLVLAQHFYDRREWPEAKAPLAPVLDSTHVYEKNAARYRMGLIYLGEEKHSEALKLFEQVATDEELKEEEDPVEVSLTSQVVKSNIKREALIDSVRAYTYVHKEQDGSPVEYYSRISPSEIHFQEVIEKLALRYISLKRYRIALQLLRTLTERVSDPLKVLNIYQEVLLKMTPEERLRFPADELQAVLERLVTWTSTYNVPMNLIIESKNFFEKHTRELATTSHDLAKKEPESERRSELLSRAREYYAVYLKYFRDSGFASRMAANLGDVHALEKSYLRCGELLLRLFEGEYGNAPNDLRARAIQDSLVCLEKKAEYPFYEQIRVRGLQIRAVNDYLRFDRKQASNAPLNLLLLKAEYEQGFYETVLPKLYTFIGRFKSTRQATDAAELVLDYYNTRNEPQELNRAADRILKMGIGDAAFKAKLKNIQKHVHLNRLLDKVESISVTSNATEARSYLTAAFSMEDPSLRSMALQKALASSKRDQDVTTFFKTAGVFVQQEKDVPKKAALLLSMASEKTRITRYHEALGILDQVLNLPSAPTDARSKAIESAISIALSLKDPRLIESYSRKAAAQRLSPELRDRVAKSLSEFLDSPNLLTAGGEDLLLRLNGQGSLPSSLFKGRAPATRAHLSRTCQASPAQPPCIWLRLQQNEQARAAALTAVRSTPQNFEGVQKVAPVIADLTGRYQQLEGKGDPQIDMIAALRSHEALLALSGYLRATARTQAEFAQILIQKADESERGAKAHLERCRLVVSQSAAVTPVNSYCDTGSSLPLPSLVYWRYKPYPAARASDPSGGRFDAVQKAIFASNEDPDQLLEAAVAYYEAGYFNHAAGAALIGMGLHPALQPDFSAVAGCATLKLGLFGEANFHLKRASDHKQLKTTCAATLNQISSSSN